MSSPARPRSIRFARILGGMLVMLCFSSGALAQGLSADPYGLRFDRGYSGQHYGRHGDQDYRYHFIPDSYLSRNRGRPAPARPGLRYHRWHYPYSDYQYNRERYPHTFAGQFALPGRRPRLSLHLRQAPGNSPFGRYQHLGQYYEDVYPTIPDDDPESDSYVPGGNSARGNFEQPRLLPLPPVVRPAPAPEKPAVPGPNVVNHRPRGRHPLHCDQAAGSSEATHAWALLAEGDAEGAQFAFSSMALAYMGQGGPKIGFALAVAMRGEYCDAAWTMRRAVTISPGALHEIELDDTVREKTRSLLAHFDGHGNHGVCDDLFMTAALHVLLDENDAALAAINSALEFGDIQLSTFRLKGLIEGTDNGQFPPRDPTVRVRRDLTASAR